MLQCPKCKEAWDPPTSFCPKCRAMGIPITKERAVRRNYEGLKNELSQSMVGTEKDRIAQERADILKEFKRIMSPERIEKLTYPDLIEFISYINEKSPHHDVTKDITIENFDQVKRNLDYFLYGSDPLEDRINAVLVYGPLKEHPLKIEGFQRSGSILLHLKDPRYCIWNDKTQDVLLFYHLVERNDDTWKMYEQNLKIQTRLGKDLEVDLYHLDYLLKKIR
jgi:hypothetical protein